MSTVPNVAAPGRRPERPMAVERGSGLALGLGVGFSFAFTALIWYAGAHWLNPGPLTPERPGFWYQWQLQAPTAWTRATAWIGYVAHQCTIWWIIWYAQQRRPAYTRGLHRFNAWALAANAVFISLHFIQTQVWYDGLAQDVHETTAQWSVILLLMAVLVMENQRRGLVFGRRSTLVTEAGGWVRRYHGYYFAWATIYTFWYHPMEDTWGHLFGFLYMFFLLLQGSLFFTRAHVNRYWTVFQEGTVIAHGAMVAYLAGQAWEMFFMGFLGMFVVTQMHGLGLSVRTRWCIGLSYVALLAVLYAGQGWRAALAVTGIPLTLLGGAVVLSLLVVGGLRWARRGARPAPAAASEG